MKKIVFLIAFISIQTLVHAQLNAGADLNFNFPQGTFKNMATFGFGGGVSIGYTFFQRVDLSFVYKAYNYNRMVEDLKINSKSVEAKYFFLTGNIRPYIGCGAGSYNRKYRAGTMLNKDENGFAIEPKIGVLLDAKIVKNLYLDGSVSYFQFRTEFNEPKAINLAIGVKYYIDFKKSTN